MAKALILAGGSFWIISVNPPSASRLSRRSIGESIRERLSGLATIGFRETWCQKQQPAI
jgi:hypothetical protein